MPDYLFRLIDASGFQLGIHPGTGDLTLRDDSDGFGVYIAEWNSPQACPCPEHIRVPVTLENARLIASMFNV